LRKPPLVDPKSPKPLEPAKDETFLVVRLEFSNEAGDTDNKVRISPGAVRLLAWRDEGGQKKYLNYTPIGTLEGGHTLARNKADDYMFVPSGKAADFVFKVKRDDVFKDKAGEFKEGIFVEAKRMARIPLAGLFAKSPVVYSADVEVLRKDSEAFKKLPKRTEAGDLTASVETVSGPLEKINLELKSKIFSKLNPGTYQDGSDVNIGSGGTGTMQQKKFKKLNVDGSQSVKLISTGELATDELFVPDGKKMVQVVAKPPAKGDAWAWAGELSKFELVDSGGNKYKANGGVARFKESSVDHMVAAYNAEGDVGSVPRAEGRAIDVWIVYNIPSGTQITGLQYDGKPLADKGIKVP